MKIELATTCLKKENISICICNEKKKLVARIFGEIDHHTAPKIRSKIDECLYLYKNDLKFLIIDMKNVTFMDTSGIGLMLGRFKISNSMNILLKVINIPENLKRIINLSGIKNLGIL